MQPTLINKPSNNSPYDAKFTKCGYSENSFSFKSYAISNNCILFLFSWEKGFLIGNSGILYVWGPINAPRADNLLWGNVEHTDYAFIVSVMASNIVDGL